MKPEVGRRVFVGSMVAGLPLLATRTGLLAQGAAAGHAHAGGPVDPVLDHLVRQIAVIHNSAKAGPRGEHFRALAAQLRTLAVYDRQIGVDDQVRTTLQALVDQQGRNAVLYADPDVDGRRQTLQAYGFRLEPRAQQSAVVPTHEEREAALDALLAGGITPVFDQMAATADTVSARIDRRASRNVAVMQDGDWWQGFCAELWNQYQQSQTIAGPFCAVAKFFPAVMPSCAALEAGAMVLLLAWAYECGLRY
jgi:hypothetical protein